MRRTIVGWHDDGEGDWVAELSCLHAQQIQRRPPFEGDIDCSRCDRAELPEGLHVVRTAGPFDAASLPAGLRRTHLVGAGVWGVLRVLAGEVVITIETDPPIQRRLEQGESQPIPPEVPHHLSLAGPFSLQVDFLRRDLRYAT